MYLDLVRDVSLKYNDRIKQACKPLFDCFNLNHFWYYKIRNDGRFGFFDNHIGWCEYYGGEKLYLTHPYLRNPKLLHPGIYILKHEAEVGSRLFSSGFNSEFQIVNQVPDGIEAYGFSSFSSNDFQMSFFVNEINLLRLFMKKFRENNRLIFTCLEDNLIDLVGLIGPLFNSPCGVEPLSLSSRERFLKKIGVETGASFSQIEVEIVKRLAKGYSASRIAAEMSRSKRTIEHRIERLKEKTVSRSKLELLEKFREISTSGFSLLT